MRVRRESVNPSVGLDSFCGPVDCSRQAPLSMGVLQAKILEQVAISLSRASSRPGNRTHISSIAGRFYTIGGTREAPTCFQITPARQLLLHPSGDCPSPAGLSDTLRGLLE